MDDILVNGELCPGLVRFYDRNKAALDPASQQTHKHVRVMISESFARFWKTSIRSKSAMMGQTPTTPNGSDGLMNMGTCETDSVCRRSTLFAPIWWKGQLVLQRTLPVGRIVNRLQTRRSFSSYLKFHNENNGILVICRPAYSVMICLAPR